MNNWQQFIFDTSAVMTGLALAMMTAPTDDPYPPIDDATWPDMLESIRASDPPSHPDGTLIDDAGEVIASPRPWYVGDAMAQHVRIAADAGGEHVWHTWVIPISEMLATEKQSHQTTIAQWQATQNDLTICQQQMDVLIDEIEALHDAQAAELAALEAQHQADMQMLNDTIADLQSALQTQQQMTQQAVANLEQCQAQLDCPGDLNGDGVIDGADVAILIGAWGPCDG